MFLIGCLLPSCYFYTSDTLFIRSGACVSVCDGGVGVGGGNSVSSQKGSTGETKSQQASGVNENTRQERK